MKKLMMVVLAVWLVAPCVNGQTLTGDVARVSALNIAGDWKGVVAAVNKVYADYSLEQIEKDAWLPVRLVGYKAGGMYSSGDKDGAKALLAGVADNPKGTAAMARAYTSQMLARYCAWDGDLEGAHLRAVQYLTHTDGSVWGDTGILMFSYVRPSVLGKDAYVSLLEALILKIPAVEANAKFLGRLKSELEKVK